MEIVIENPTDTNPPMTPSNNINPGNFGTLPGPAHRSSAYRVHGIDGMPPPPTDYYGTLPLRTPRSQRGQIIGVPSPPTDFEITQVRRVDKSGLLEIVEPDPTRCRSRHLTGAENPLGHPAVGVIGGGGGGTLTRRIDRSGLLEAVPEVPDQLLLQAPKSPELNATKTTDDPSSSASASQNRSIVERLLTGAEIDHHKDQIHRPNQSLSPRTTGSIKSSVGPLSQVDESRASTPSSIHGTQSSNSPYARRHQINPNPILDIPSSAVSSAGVCSSSTSISTSNSNNEIDPRSHGQFTNVSSSTKFLSNTLDPRAGRQTYVDLTGASYTRACANSPIVVSSRAADPPSNALNIKEDCKEKKHPPDCLGRLSPKSRGDKSPLKVSSIPDVIEAHGSRVTGTSASSGNAGNAIGGKAGSLSKETPEGERAEAEGCEHTAIESLEETRVSFKASNKLLQHNDNIQTLRVIILSEQL